MTAVPGDRLVAEAQRLADDVWWPQALAADAAGRLPADLLDQAAAAGLYGVAGPLAAGGLGPYDGTRAGRITEVLVSGCLSAALVWVQHHGTVAAVAGNPTLASRWLPDLMAGRLRSGVCLGGGRPGPGRLTAHWTGTDWVLDGRVPWVTGYGHVDLLRVAAVEGDHVVTLLVDADHAPTITLQWPDLSAAGASGTARIEYRGHHVPGDRLLTRVPIERWSATDAVGSALNGFFALGVVRRCALLLATDAFDEAAEQSRSTLAGLVRSDPDPGALAAARTAASVLAQRAAAALVVHTGAPAVLAGSPADLLWREAAFSLVFGNRPAIRDTLLSVLTG